MVPGSKGPRYLKVIFKYELDSKEGPSCSPLKTQKNFEKRQYLVDNHLSFQSILVRGYPYPLEKNIFIAVMDILEHAKKIKSCENINILG